MELHKHFTNLPYFYNDLKENILNLWKFYKKNLPFILDSNMLILLR